MLSLKKNPHTARLAPCAHAPTRARTIIACCTASRATAGATAGATAAGRQGVSTPGVWWLRELERAQSVERVGYSVWCARVYNFNQLAL